MDSRDSPKNPSGTTTHNPCLILYPDCSYSLPVLFHSRTGRASSVSRQIEHIKTGKYDRFSQNPHHNPSVPTPYIIFLSTGWLLRNFKWLAYQSCVRYHCQIHTCQVLLCPWTSYLLPQCCRDFGASVTCQAFNVLATKGCYW